MNYFLKYTITLWLLFFYEDSAAQALPAENNNITGCWQTYRNEEYMQFNIEQRNNELCGYSYDYELYDHRSHCKANFEGGYNNEKKFWYFTGNSFIENSGTHVLMRIILWRNKYDSSNILRGKVYLQSSDNKFSMDGDNIIIKKISNRLVRTPGQKTCFPVQPKPPAKPIEAPETKPIAVKPIQPKPKTATGKPLKPVAPKPGKKEIVKEDLPKIDVPATKKDISQLELKMTARKQVEQSRVVINVNKINLKLYDNGTVDGDTVSVFYNGRLILSHQGLSEKAIELNIQLDETTNIHEITMYAENLGSIVPNTALVVVTAGNKRYELRSKASLEENAVLVFEYKPN